jgi:hypothetical protein
MGAAHLLPTSALPSGLGRGDPTWCEVPTPRFFFSVQNFYRWSPKLTVTAKSRKSQPFTVRVNSNEFLIQFFLYQNNRYFYPVSNQRSASSVVRGTS